MSCSTVCEISQASFAFDFSGAGGPAGVFTGAGSLASSDFMVFGATEPRITREMTAAGNYVSVGIDKVEQSITLTVVCGDEANGIVASILDAANSSQHASLCGSGVAIGCCYSKVYSGLYLVSSKPPDSSVNTVPVFTFEFMGIPE